MIPEHINSFLKRAYSFSLESSTLIQDSADNIVYKISTPHHQTYILRISKRANKASDIAFEADFISFLYHQGLQVPQIIPNTTGQPVSMLNGHPACLFSFCSGHTFHVSATNKPSEKMAINGGQMLARLHQTASTYCTQGRLKTTRSLFYEMERVLQQKECFNQKYIAGDLFVQTVEQMLADIKPLCTNDTIVHNDFRIQNLLFEEENVSAVLDFDWACIGTGLKDLGHALVEWSFPDATEECWWDIFTAFLTGYKKIYPDTDLKKLWLWIRFACLSDACTYFMDSINQQEEPRHLDSYMYQKYLFFTQQKIKPFL